MSLSQKNEHLKNVFIHLFIHSFLASPTAYGSFCIQATTVTYAAAVATQDPLIHCAGPRIEPQPLQQP